MYFHETFTDGTPTSYLRNYEARFKEFKMVPVTNQKRAVYYSKVTQAI